MFMLLGDISMINTATDLADIVEGMTQYLPETGASRVVKDILKCEGGVLFSRSYVKGGSYGH